MSAPKPAPPPATISREDLEAHARRAGLTLTETQKATLLGAYGHLARMCERVRAGGNRPREVEPAIIFKHDGKR